MSLFGEEGAFVEEPPDCSDRDGELTASVRGGVGGSTRLLYCEEMDRGGQSLKKSLKSSGGGVRPCKSEYGACTG
jgi:hypothetical protein